MILRTGSLNRDTFLGSGEADHFIVGAEDDIPYGNGGADPFQAGDGDGRLHGGSDRDTMLGGAANDGRDIFPCTAGDGVDLIWGFRPGQDFRVTGCTPADVDAFTCIRPVENTGRDGVNPLDAGTSLLVAQMPVRAAQPVAPAPTAPTPAPLPPAEEVSATVKVVNAWWGGFQGEITVTANRAVTDWAVLLGTRWQVQEVWNAQLAGTTAVPLGQLLGLDDAGWNATLAAGQSVTVGFTAATGQPGVLANQAILDGLWIA